MFRDPLTELEGAPSPAFVVRFASPSLALASLLFAACTAPDPQRFLGVRLGMSASQVRDNFARPGSWEVETSPDGLLHMGWTPIDAADGVQSAHFELHEGLLVAVRASLADPSLVVGDPHIELPELVRVLDPGAGDTADFTLIARNCPLHAAEVTALLAH